jgi:hypothetical protein
MKTLSSFKKLINSDMVLIQSKSPNTFHSFNKTTNMSNKSHTFSKASLIVILYIIMCSNYAKSQVKTTGNVSAIINGTPLTITAEGLANPSTGQWSAHVEYSDQPTNWQVAGTFVSVYTGYNQLSSLQLTPGATNLLTLTNGNYNYTRTTTFIKQGTTDTVGVINTNVTLTRITIDSISGTGTLIGTGNWAGVGTINSILPFTETWVPNGPGMISGTMTVPLVPVSGPVINAVIHSIYSFNPSVSLASPQVRTLTASFITQNPLVFDLNYMSTISEQSAIITNNITQCGLYTWPVNGVTYSNTGTYIYTPSVGLPQILNLTITCVTSNVPTTSEWGLIILFLILLTTGILFLFGKRHSIKRV